MSVQITTYRLWPDKHRGLQGLESALEALSATLPYARIETIWLDHVPFRVDVDRFPGAIWQRLLADKTWHAKLVSHLSQSLTAERPEQRTKQQAKFFRLLQKPWIRVALGGTMLFDPESTPGLLSTVLIPKVRALGCRLSVDAFADVIRKNLSGTTLQIAMLQRECYRDFEKPASI
ncbi:hypothetical protein D3C87_831690 [compost metagenome]